MEAQTFITIPVEDYNNLIQRFDRLEDLIIKSKSESKPNSDEYIDAIEAMRILGIGLKAVRKFDKGGKRPISKKLVDIRRSGEIQFRKIGKEYQYLKSSLMEYKRIKPSTRGRKVTS